MDSGSQEKVFVITRKMLWITILVILLIAIITTLPLWFLSHKSNSPTENSGSSANRTSDVLSTFTLTSEAGVDGGTLPVEYTCDGTSVTPALSWSGAPGETKEFAIMMTTIPVDGSTKWSWVLYNIPATTTSLAKGSSGVGTLGVGSHFVTQAYQPPCSKGPGLNKYTFTIYALSENPVLPANQIEVTGEVLTQAISNITLDSASLSLSYQRSQQ